MNRRNFLKGFLAATGTLAVAPALVLEPIKTTTIAPSVLLNELIDQQMYLNRLMVLQDYIIGTAAKGIRLSTPEMPSDYIEINGLGFVQDPKLKLQYE